MKTEEEIRKKKEMFEALLEATEEYEMGTRQRQRMRIKLEILDWVLGENLINLRNKKMPRANHLELVKTRILKLMEEKSDTWFSTKDLVYELKASKQTIQKYVRELNKEGFFEVEVKMNDLGCPKIYKIKLGKENDK